MEVAIPAAPAPSPASLAWAQAPGAVSPPPPPPPAPSQTDTKEGKHSGGQRTCLPPVGSPGGKAESSRSSSRSGGQEVRRSGGQEAGSPQRKGVKTHPRRRDPQGSMCRFGNRCRRREDTARAVLRTRAGRSSLRVRARSGRGSRCRGGRPVSVSERREGIYKASASFLPKLPSAGPPRAERHGPPATPDRQRSTSSPRPSQTVCRRGCTTSGPETARCRR